MHLSLHFSRRWGIWSWGGLRGGAHRPTSISTVIFACTLDRFKGPSHENIPKFSWPEVGLIDHVLCPGVGFYDSIDPTPDQIPTIFWVGGGWEGGGGASPRHAIDRCIMVTVTGQELSWIKYLEWRVCVYVCACLCACVRARACVCACVGCEKEKLREAKGKVVNWGEGGIWQGIYLFSKLLVHIEGIGIKAVPIVAHPLHSDFCRWERPANATTLSFDF